MKVSALIATFLLSFTAQAEVSGKTADGCTYRIINGKYLTDCSSKAKATEPKDTIVSNIAAAPVTTYDSVPVRENQNAPQSSFGTATNSASTLAIPVSKPVQSAIVVDRDQEVDATIYKSEPVKKYKFKDSSYLGVELGSSTIRESSSGSSTGLGISFGTNLDEIFGIELNYAYTKQNLNLGLAGRDSAQPMQSNYGNNSDASLSSHLFSAEAQAHFSDTESKFRPFLGAGLGLKLSNLEEKNLNSTSSIYNPNTSNSNSSLSQQSLGATGSGGLKFRVSPKVELIGSFRYFAPLARQNARLESKNNSPYAASYPGATRLTREDSALTGSSQYQISGGLHYIF